MVWKALKAPTRGVCRSKSQDLRIPNVRQFNLELTLPLNTRSDL